MINDKAFIFDMDGTLVDNMPFQFKAWQKYFSLYNSAIEIEEIERLCKVGMPQKTVENFFNKKMTAEEISEHLDRKEVFFRELYDEHFAPVNGLHNFLERACKLEIPLAIATGSDYRNVDYTLDRLNIRRYFKTIVTADDIKNGKPNPESFLLAAELLKVAPRNCVVFEDSFTGIEASYRAGMQTIALTTTHKAEELKKLSGVLTIIDDYDSAEPADFLTNKLSHFI